MSKSKNAVAKIESTSAVAHVEPIANEAVAPIVTATAVAKADKARTIFKEAYSMNPVPQRKDIINRFVSEAGLTKAGAATYLQNMKKKAGLVVARTKSEPASA
jgi:hypothetical protein